MTSLTPTPSFSRAAGFWVFSDIPRPKLLFTLRAFLSFLPQPLCKAQSRCFREIVFFQAISGHRWTRTVEATHQRSPDVAVIRERRCFSCDRNKPARACVYAFAHTCIQCETYFTLTSAEKLLMRGSKWHDYIYKHVITSAFVLHLNAVVTLV